MIGKTNPRWQHSASRPSSQPAAFSLPFYSNPPRPCSLLYLKYTLTSYVSVPALPESYALIRLRRRLLCPHPPLITWGHYRLLLSFVCRPFISSQPNSFRRLAECHSSGPYKLATCPTGLSNSHRQQSPASLPQRHG